MAASLPHEAAFGFWPPFFDEAKAGGYFLFFLFPGGTTPPAENLYNRRWAFLEHAVMPDLTAHGASVSWSSRGPPAVWRPKVKREQIQVPKCIWFIDKTRRQRSFLRHSQWAKVLIYKVNRQDKVVQGPLWADKAEGEGPRPSVAPVAAQPRIHMTGGRSLNS